MIARELELVTGARAFKPRGIATQPGITLCHGGKGQDKEYYECFNVHWQKLSAGRRAEGGAAARPE